MATTKITDLTAYTDPISTDVVPIVDVTSDVTKKVSIADLMENAGSGTEALPGIAFDGDPNTGIYSPGADQLAVATGGFGRLSIDSSGNVGIAAVGQEASYTDYGKALVFGTSAETTLGIVLRTGSSGTSSIAFADNSGSGAGAQDGLIEYSQTTRALNFHTAGDSSPRLVIDSSGRVGIGSSAPSAPFHLNAGTTNNALFVESTDGDVSIGLADNAGGCRILQAGGNLRFKTGGNANEFGVGDNERMVITSTGAVGIGTTSPGANLEVKAASAPVIRLNQADTYYAPIKLVGNDLEIRSSSGTIEFYNGANDGDSSTEKMRIDTSGRLLVGTSSARVSALHTARLQVEGANFSDSTISATSTESGNFGASLHLGKLRGSSIVSSGDSLGRVQFNGFDGSALISAAHVTAQVDGTPVTNGMPGRLVFSTTADGSNSPTERMRIASNGSVATFCTNATDGIWASSAATAGTTRSLFIGSYGGSSTYSGTISYKVFTNGDVVNTNNSYGAISDIKLKENIVDASSQWNDLKALQVRNYNFKEGQTHTQIGLVAQEVELVSPGLVSESPDCDEDGNDLGTVTKSVNYSVLYMKAVKALQEAMERIETLEQRLSDAGIA